MLGDRTHRIAETTSSRTSLSVAETAERRWIRKEILPDLTAAVQASRQGRPVVEILGDLVHAEPWLASDAAVLDDLADTLAELGAGI